MNGTNSTRADRRTTAKLKRWVLLTGNRLVVSALMLLGIGSLFAVAGIFDLITVTTPSRMLWYLNGTINGLLTLVPISVGVNQIVLSHEFGSAEDLYNRRTGVTTFRERVERKTGTSVIPPHVSELFSTLLTTVSDTALAVQREYDRDRNEPPPEEVTALTQSLVQQTARTTDELDAGETSMLRTLLVLLDYDDSAHFVQTRRLRETSTALDTEVTTKLQRLEELLTDIDVARQFLKTVVVERQLAQLSRLLIYTGIPSIGIAALGIFSYRDVAWLALSNTLLVGVASVLVMVSLVPLAILSAYILRIATVARQTAAFGPFVPESKHPSDEDWRP